MTWRGTRQGGGGDCIVGFDPDEKPFVNGAPGKPKTLLRKVSYADDVAESYAKNPHYLFLVKKREWSYEREWRVVRALEGCDELTTSGDQRVALCNIASPAVKEINFGYAYDQATLPQDRATAATSCPAAQIFHLQVNRKSGTLERVKL